MIDRIEHYTVTGHWPFPPDMMRRDGSVAASDADQALIDRLSGEHVDDVDDLSREHEIHLRMADGPSRYPPNDERWRSFGWRVTAPEDPFAALAEEGRRMKALHDSALALLSPEQIEALEWYGLHASH